MHAAASPPPTGAVPPVRLPHDEPASPDGPGARLRLVVLVAVSLALGLSPFLHGGYDQRTWTLGGLVLAAMIVALALSDSGRTRGPGRAATVAVGGLVALGLWSLLSARWAPSTSLAAEGGQRLLVLGGLLLVLVLLVRDARAAAWSVGAATAGVLGVAVWTLLRMLGDDGLDVFLAGRLNGPLGYVNGQGSVYVLALMACLSLAGWRRSALLAGGGAGAATLLAGLALLTQSRGVVLATVLGVLVVILCVGGRLRRAGAAVVIGAAIVAVLPTLTDVLSRTTFEGTPASAVRDAGTALLLASVAVGVAWGLLVAAAARLPAATVRGLRRAAVVAIVAVAVVGLVVAAVRAPTIADRVADQYTAFVEVDVQPDGTGQRLLSGAGTRYDYWRIAVDAFADRPMIGTGAGGYAIPYFRERRTPEDIQQPHSLGFQTLAELGLVGGLLLAAFAAALLWGVVAAVRRAGSDPRERFLVAAGAGMVAAWALHANIDWIALLPGVTGVAFVGAAAVLRARPAAAVARTPIRLRDPRVAVPAVVGVAILLVAVVGLSTRLLVEHDVRAARAAAADDPATAIRRADAALARDADALGAYHAKAAALARYGDPAPAIATLQAALRQRPDDFVTWALLGDLQTRSGDRAAARRSYARALALNPRDASLREAVESASGEPRSRDRNGAAG